MGERELVYEFKKIRVFERVYQSKIWRKNGDLYWELLEDGKRVLCVKIEEAVAPSAKFICKILSRIFYRGIDEEIIDALCEFIADLIRAFI